MAYDIRISRAALAEPALGWCTYWSSGEALGDWRVAPPGDAVNPGGLDASGQIASAVVLSLFTDRRAPEGWRPEVSDRRGWWGDVVAPDGQEPEPIGSHLWLLKNEVATAENAARARIYAEEALAWLVRDKVAARVVVTSGLLTDPERGVWLAVEVHDRAGAIIFDRKFARLWREV